MNSSDYESNHSGTVFRPERGNLLAAFLMAAIMLLVIGYKPLLLGWLLIIPAVLIYWCLRAHTRVSSNGVSCHYAFRKAERIGWDNIEGVAFKGSTVCLRDKAGKLHAMPGVSFNSLPSLSAASEGRIPDPLTAAHEAADGKVEVIDREGHGVLMTKEEYQRHLDEQQASGRGQQARDDRRPSSTSQDEEK